MTFDSFECAIHAMAPQLAHRECRLLGYGVVTCPDSFDEAWLLQNHPALARSPASP
jgi:hypothetical protein